MYIPPLKTNKMLYVGLVCLLMSIIYMKLFPCEGRELLTEKGDRITTPIGCSGEVGDILSLALFLFGITFTPVGLIYAIKEYRLKNKT